MAKRIYSTRKDFLKYKDDLIKRYSMHADVEIYKMVDDKWQPHCEHDHISSSDGCDECLICGTRNY